MKKAAVLLYMTLIPLSCVPQNAEEVNLKVKVQLPKNVQFRDDKVDVTLSIGKDVTKTPIFPYYFHVYQNVLSPMLSQPDGPSLRNAKFNEGLFSFSSLQQGYYAINIRGYVGNNLYVFQSSPFALLKTMEIHFDLVVTKITLHAKNGEQVPGASLYTPISETESFATPPSISFAKQFIDREIFLLADKKWKKIGLSVSANANKDSVHLIQGGSSKYLADQPVWADYVKWLDFTPGKDTKLDIDPPKKQGTGVKNLEVFVRFKGTPYKLDSFDALIQNGVIPRTGDDTMQEQTIAVNINLISENGEVQEMGIWDSTTGAFEFWNIPEGKYFVTRGRYVHWKKELIDQMEELSTKMVSTSYSRAQRILFQKQYEQAKTEFDKVLENHAGSIEGKELVLDKPLVTFIWEIDTSSTPWKGTLTKTE